MGEVQVPAQVRSPVEPALSLKSELEAYDRDKDRRSLLGALKEQFLLNRYVAASQAEKNRNLALQTLFNQMERMSDKMLLKTVAYRPPADPLGVLVQFESNPLPAFCLPFASPFHSANWSELAQWVDLDGGCQPSSCSWQRRRLHSAATQGLRAIVAGLPDAAEEDIDQSQVSWNMGAGIDDAGLGGGAGAASPEMKR
jgi:hypothetical protein